MNNKRIVSLLPAATEIVCALGLEQQLVGRSHECDFPENIANVPICSAAKFSNSASSASIDTQVKQAVLDAISIYTIDTEKLAALQPDVIITQDQCKVCAVNLADVEQALCNVTHTNSTIFSVQPNTLSDILGDIQRLGTFLGAEKQAEELLEDLNTRIEIVKHKVKFVQQRAKVACIEWLDPLMIAGNWTPELIEIAGGSSVLAQQGTHSPFITWEQLAATEPDILVIAPCGFGIARTLSEISILTQHPLWHTLPAVKNNKVYVADGNQYFNRSGPRIVDTIEILAEIIQANQFYFGMEGTGWVQFG